MICIIILEYNNYIDTIKCINSVLESNYLNYQIILVDNNSEINIYNKLELFCKKKPLVDIYRAPKNGGYGYGNNYGIKKSQKYEPDYFLILNNDTIIESDTIQLLVDAIEKKPKSGIVFPLVYFYRKGKTNILNSAGGVFSKFGFANDKYYRYKISNIEKQIDNNFFYAPGSCFLVRSKLAYEIQLFDENIFMYWDDVDFSWRIRLTGHDIDIIKKAKIFHKFSITMGKDKNHFKISNREFSWLYVIVKNLSFKNIIKYSPIYIFFMVVKIIFSLKNKEYFNAIIAAYSKFFRNLEENIKQHKVVQKNRKVDDKEILSFTNHLAMKQSIFYRDQG